MRPWLKKGVKMGKRTQLKRGFVKESEKSDSFLFIAAPRSLPLTFKLCSFRMKKVRVPEKQGQA